jgi:formylglycine-generating enzyme required for sulfatase activity
MLLAGALLISNSACGRSIWNTKRVTPLVIELQKSQGHYGVMTGEYLTPETIEIPGGQYSMGSDPDKAYGTDEQPRHRVSLDTFQIGRLEVTNAQYAEFVKSTGYDNSQWAETNLPGHENDPARAISWLDAQAYCQWLSQITGKNYRLPTEAEWEYAGGGVQNVRFSWGNQWDLAAANVGSSQPGVTAAAKYPANTFGVYDTAGNVWEWCGDWYAEDYYRHSPIESPTGPEEGKMRVMRGGAWNSGENSCRLATRNHNLPDLRDGTIGFRILLGRKIPVK